MGIKTTSDDLIQQKQCRSDATALGGIHHIKIRLLIQYMQMLRDGIVSQLLPGKRHQLIEYAQSISESTVGLHRYDMQCRLLRLYPFFFTDSLEMRDHVRNSDAMEIKNLTTRQNGWKNFMLFRCGQNKNCMRRRFLEGLEECIERRLRQHVYLVDDVHLVLSALRWDAHLVNNGPDVFDLVVGSRIQFKNIECVIFFLARFKPVDGSCKNPCRCCLPHSARTAKQVCLSHLLLCNGLLEGTGNSILAHNSVPILGPVFAR